MATITESPPASGRSILLPEAMAHQATMLLDPARHKIVVCGRRWGKTASGLLAVILGHGPQDHQHLPGAVDGARIIWVAPTFDMLSEIWRDVKRSCEGAWSNKSEQLHRIELGNGGVVKCGSSDRPDSLRGPGWDGVVMDEAAFGEQGGRHGEEAWKSVLRPTLVDRQGWSLKYSTPNGFNWFHDQYMIAADRPGWARWQHPSSDNPLVTQPELDEALLDMGPRIYAQEHLAEFVSMQGAEFDTSYFHEGIWFDEWPEHPRWIVIALDPSKGKTDKSDYSAFAIILVGTDGKLYVDCDMQRRDCRQIIDDGINLYHRWKPHAYGVETNQFQEILADDMYAQARAAGVNLPLHNITHTSNQKKIVRIRATLTPLLARDELRFLRGSRGAKLLVDQLRAFPVDEYDDGPDALEMGVTLLAWLTAGEHVGRAQPIYTA